MHLTVHRDGAGGVAGPHLDKDPNPLECDDHQDEIQAEKENVDREKQDCRNDRLDTLDNSRRFGWRGRIGRVGDESLLLGVRRGDVDLDVLRGRHEDEIFIPSQIQLDPMVQS